MRRGCLLPNYVLPGYHFKKCLHDPRIKMGSRLFAYQANDMVRRPRFAIGPVLDHRIVDVGDCEDACVQVNGFAR